MVMPSDIGVIDTMMGLPSTDRRWWAASMAATLKDAESRSGFQHAAGYMFKDLPQVERTVTAVDELLAAMDAFGINKALVPISFDDTLSIEAVTSHPDRLLGCISADPNLGAEGIRRIRRAKTEVGAVAVGFFPCGCVPIVAINDPAVYPVYATCEELGMPVFVNVGVPGPRVPMHAQRVEHLDEVMYDFPELRVVMRHGGEPWDDLAVKLMLKWPNLYYSTSAFAPKHYPKSILDYANTRGADKVIYAGYYPYGLTLERSFAELGDLPLNERVWPKFLRGNAEHVLGLDASGTQR